MSEAEGDVIRCFICGAPMIGDKCSAMLAEPSEEENA